MTDKQIIIDGVDVSRCTCRYYAYNRHLCSLIGDDLCEEHSDCLYKQLKRKEQECEEFRKANDEKNELLAKLGCPTTATAKRKVFCLQEQLDQLKAENDELKRQHEGDKGLITSTGKQNYQLLQEYDKLKTALTEIKEIAEMQCVCGVNCQDMKIILQKISEVEDGV